MAFLCEDVKSEIFSRTSLQTLVSIYDWHLYANASRGLNNIDLGNFLPYNFRILASSDIGIMAFESPDPRTHGLFRYYICNPFTQQFLALPNPKTKYLTKRAAIVMVSSNPLRFKIVRLSLPRTYVQQRRDKVYNAYRCEIFDSKTWAWRQLDVVKLSSYVWLTDTQPITTRGGSVYMLLTNKEILKIEANSERWRIFSSPIQTLKYASYYTLRQLVKYEGKLGFACKPANGRWEIWVLKDDESWEKMYVFNEE